MSKHGFRKVVQLIFIVGICGISTSACEKKESAQAKLPLSLNEVMVALVNQAADPLWVAAWQNPQTEKEWRNLEYLAAQLELGGKLLEIPGTGPLDETWTSDPRWSEFAKQLVSAGEEASAAVQSRDIEAINIAGDRIVEVCEACHIVFKPGLPTGGKFGELSPTPSDPNR
ncbi:hypothetical protein [Aurantivibrio infirmus]